MKSIRLLNRLCMPQYYDWFENLPKPKSKTDIFMNELWVKYKKHSFDNFDELYTYLAINKRDELFCEGYKLCFINNNYVLVKNNFV